MGFYLFLALLAATFLSEDAACFSAGAFVANGNISLFSAGAACFTGIFLGDLLIFFAGRVFGAAVLKRAPLKWLLNENALEKASAWFAEKGGWAIFFSRFTPGLRVPVYFAAGTVKTNFLRFALILALAAGIWTPLLVFGAAFFGAAASRNALSLILLVVFSLLVLKFILKLTDWKKRRLLVGRLRRIWKWEFWSARIFYLPILLYIVRLAFKHNSLTVFSAANPAIEAGGFVGESKREIYRGLAKSEAAQKHLLRFEFLAKNLCPREKLTRAHRFMRENDLSFPIALKPDVGERGAGVFLVKTAEELTARLNSAATDLILQEFAPGAEFSVFYYRYPNEKRGKIFAVTEKQFPAVSGDGKSTLETLILRDERAVCLAEAYFARNRERLAGVPPKGEAVELIDIGTHSRGAIFLDGGRVKTIELENKIDEICRGFAGFYFGRFDLRAQSSEDFKLGENFKIVELNGVTSEATSIYDPKNNLFEAYRVLFKQWQTAFEIGAQNRQKGFAPATVLQLTRLVLENRLGIYKNPKSEIKNSQLKNVSDSFCLRGAPEI